MTSGLTGHALFDPEPLISREQAAADAAEFFAKAAAIPKRRKQAHKTPMEERAAICKRVDAMVEMGSNLSDAAKEVGVNYHTLKKWLKEQRTGASPCRVGRPMDPERAKLREEARSMFKAGGHTREEMAKEFAIPQRTMNTWLKGL